MLSKQKRPNNKGTTQKNKLYVQLKSFGCVDYKCKKCKEILDIKKSSSPVIHLRKQNYPRGPMGALITGLVENKHFRYL